MSLNNCLFFAVWRWFRHGGYLIIRRSHYGWWPHVLWAEHLHDADIQHYVPIEYSERFAASHKVLFHGYVSRSDTTRPKKEDGEG